MQNFWNDRKLELPFHPEVGLLEEKFYRSAGRKYETKTPRILPNGSWKV